MGCSSSSQPPGESGQHSNEGPGQSSPPTNHVETQNTSANSNVEQNSKQEKAGGSDETGAVTGPDTEQEQNGGGQENEPKAETSKTESLSVSPTLKDTASKVTSGSSSDKAASEKSSTSTAASGKSAINNEGSGKETSTSTSKNLTVSSTESKQSDNSVSKNETQGIGSDQVDFNNALRAMCRLVRTDDLYANVKPGVWSLHLERIPPNPDFSMATLVSKIQNLVELDFSGNRLGPQGFRAAVLALMYNHSVTTLNIANNQADTDSSICLGELLSRNSTLTWLDVSSNSLGKDFFSRSVGPAMKTNNSLKCLKFASCGATDLNLFLENLSENNSLIELDCSHNQLSNGEGSGRLVADVLKKPSCCMEILEMKSTGIDAKGMKSLSEGLLSNKTLKKLNAGGNEVATGSDFAELLLATVCHPQLLALSLDDTKIIDRNENTANITTTTPHRESNLIAVSLVNCTLIDDIIVSLTNRMPGQLVNLTSLDLSNNPDVAMATIKSFQHAATKNGELCSIEELHLGLDKIEHIPETLGDGSLFPKLHSLDLRKAKMNPSTVGKLSQFSLKPDGIRKLCLDGLKLSGSSAITDLLQNTSTCSLESLSMSNCALSDKDLTPLVGAIKQGLSLHMLRLSANRLSDTTVSAMVEAILSHGSYPLEGLDLSLNKISTVGAEALSKLLSSDQCRIHSLSVSGNNIDVQGLKMLVSTISSQSTLKSLECRDQKQTYDEEDMTGILKTLADNLGYTLEEDEYNEYKASTSSLPRLPNGLVINVSGLGGFPGPLGKMIDSQSIKTDYARKHPPCVKLNHVLELCAVMRGDQDGVPTLTAGEWNMIIDIDKNTSVPSWLQVSTHRDHAVYMTNVSASVSESKLEGILESEADCSVKEVCLIKDLVMKKPTGVAWVLMANQESVQNALEWYNSGQATLYGQSFTICPIKANVLESAGSQTEEKARLEMIRRKDEKKLASAEHKALLETAYQTSQRRHEYAKAHPAYADGRVW